MIKLYNYEVYAAPRPMAETRAGAAIADLLSQRLGHRVFMQIDKISQAVEAQAIAIEKAHRRILEQHERVGDQYTPEQMAAINQEYTALVNDTFTIDAEPVKLSDIAGLELFGWTRKSGIIEQQREEPPADEEEP